MKPAGCGETQPRLSDDRLPIVLVTLHGSEDTADGTPRHTTTRTAGRHLKGVRTCFLTRMDEVLGKSRVVSVQGVGATRPQNAPPVLA